MTPQEQHQQQLLTNNTYPSDHPEHEPTFTTAEAETLDFLTLYGLSAMAAIDCLHAIQEGDCPELSFGKINNPSPGRCWDCRWWDSWSCEHKGTNFKSDDFNSTKCGPDFGCIHHEKKEG